MGPFSSSGSLLDVCDVDPEGVGDVVPRVQYEVSMDTIEKD